MAVAILATLFFLLYRLGDSHNYAYADDSLPFAVRFALGSGTNVHHIMLKFLSWACRVSGLVTDNDVNRSLWLFKTYGAFMGSVGLLMIGVLTLKWIGDLKTAVVAMCVVGFSYGYWSYSIVSDFYVPGAAWVFVAVYLADKSYETTRGQSYLWLSLSAIAILVASFNHQVYSAASVAIALVLFLWRRGELPANLRLKRAALFFGSAALLGAAGYSSVYLASHSQKSFLEWVRGYEAWMKLMPYDRIQALTPVYTGVGVLRALLFPEYALHFESIYRAVQDHFRLKSLFDELYVMRDISDATCTALMILTGIVAVTIVIFILLGARRAYRDRPSQPAFWMIVAWVLVQVPLFGWWEASSNEFWIWLVPCLGFLTTGLLVRAGNNRSARILPWMFVVALLVSNSLVVSKYWDAGNCIYQTNKTYLSRTNDKDLAIMAPIYPDNLLPYLYPNRARTLRPVSAAVSIEDPRFKNEVDKSQSGRGRIFLDPVLVMPERAEAEVLRYLTGASSRDLRSELLDLESYCERAHIPLYAVMRKGCKGVSFEKCEFHGYVKWVDETLSGVSPSAEMRP